MKLRVLVASSAIIMLLVVYVWVGYFNSIVMGSSAAQLADQSAAVQTTPAQTSGAAGATGAANPSLSAPGFWQMVGGGLTSLYREAVSGFKGAGSALQAPKQYDITPAGHATPTQ